MRALAKGENLPLPSDGAVLAASGGRGALCVLALDEADRAMGPLLEPGGAMPGVRACGADHVELALDGAPPQLHRLLIILAVPADGAPLRGSPPARLAVLDVEGGAFAQYTHSGLSDERALILGEVYRRGGQWKLRAVGQGHREGLPGLLALHGAQARDVSGHDEPSRSGPILGSGDADVGDPPLDPILVAQRHVGIVNGVLEDAARATAGYRSAVEFADRRRERELAQLVDDPRRRGPDDPARGAIAARYDALVMRASADHHRSIAQLSAELRELQPSLAPQLAAWDSPAWRRRQGELPGSGLRVGEVLLPEAPELRVPLIVPFPLIRPLWLDGHGDAVAAMARGLVVRMLSASRPGELRFRAAGAGVRSAVLRGADSAGQPLDRLMLNPMGGDSAGGAGSAGGATYSGGSTYSGRDDGYSGRDDGLASALRQLVHRADLLEMARTAGADALPPDLFVGHVVLLCGQPEIDGAALDQLRALARPHARVSIVLLGPDGEVAADRVNALHIVAGEDVGLTDGWVGLQWTFRPDTGPTDAQLGALPPLG